MPHPDAAFQADRPLTVVSLLMDLNGDPWASLTLQPAAATRCLADGKVLDFEHALRALVADGWGHALSDVPVVEGWAVHVRADRSLKYGRVRAVLEALHTAGAGVIGMGSDERR